MLIRSLPSANYKANVHKKLQM